MLEDDGPPGAEPEHDVHQGRAGCWGQTPLGVVLRRPRNPERIPESSTWRSHLMTEQRAQNLDATDRRRWETRQGELGPGGQPRKHVIPHQ
jgi:hypothetical protein